MTTKRCHVDSLVGLDGFFDLFIIK
uniref:Uncharacterized protein n=1 Tax=Tetranychus urticae TaxID=32264 RepID=T1KYT9_TETUR